jgi:hypothetical protein
VAVLACGLLGRRRRAGPGARAWALRSVREARPERAGIQAQALTCPPTEVAHNAACRPAWRVPGRPRRKRRLPHRGPALCVLLVPHTRTLNGSLLCQSLTAAGPGIVSVLWPRDAAHMDSSRQDSTACAAAASATTHAVHVLRPPVSMAPRVARARARHRGWPALRARRAGDCSCQLQNQICTLPYARTRLSLAMSTREPAITLGRGGWRGEVCCHAACNCTMGAGVRSSCTVHLCGALTRVRRAR